MTTWQHDGLALGSRRNGALRKEIWRVDKESPGRQTDSFISEGVRRATFFITGRPKNNGVLEGNPVTAVTATEAGRVTW